MRVTTSAAELRAAARRGEWRGTTAGHCPAYQQANVVILPEEAAIEFAAFCTRNPTPCPIIEITPPGDPEPARAAPRADLRTDVPGYRIYRKGELAEQRGDIQDLWRDDLVTFLLGCSFTFEHALIEAGVSVRNVECGTMVPMFVSSLICLPAGRFHGPMVMTMRPIPEAQVQLVRELSARYPHAHGAPLHVGDSQAIGIADLGRPDYGDPVSILSGEVPVFWGCGVTPQAVAIEARAELMITHEPAQMFLTDLPREGPH
ncbi:MAG TPA: putative hydro-lyase [Methylomirabilota bacterium]|nr:putative hydro-lyase [Methylomirabilota bacterium]